ncbi:MAG: hypothetical protein KQH79_04215 [Bacteroidetes bacterium]|nr:hypothetical protein [Bacteroidota bacterium]
MKNLFKPCCDLCSYLLTILSIVLFSSSIVLLTYSISKDISNNNRIQRRVGDCHKTIKVTTKDKMDSALASSVDSQKTDADKKRYMTKNKVLKILQEK